MTLDPNPNPNPNPEQVIALLVRLLPSRAMDLFLNKAANGVPALRGRAAKGKVLHP